MFNGNSGTVNGVISNNTFGTVNGTVDSNINNYASLQGMFMGGIDSKFASNGNLNYALRIEGNTIHDWGGSACILVRCNTQDGSGVGRVEATIKNNTIAETATGSASGIYAQAGGSDINNDYGKIGFDIIGNNVNVTGGSSPDAVGLSVSSYGGGIYLPGYTDAPNANGPQLGAFLTGSKGNTFSGTTNPGGVITDAPEIGADAFTLAVP
jgi:hypothetical protein